MIPKICLNMIVKNEAHILPRLFNSLKEIIDDYVIIDTGSTDNTKEIIKEYWDKLDVPGHIATIPFKNFGYNRTEALKYAKEKSKSDFFLLLDADMVLVNNGFSKEQLVGKQMVLLKQKNAFIEWYNVRLINAKLDAICKGVTHEYYESKNSFYENLETLSIEDIGDGGCKQNKFKRDIELLSQGIKDEPDNNRYYFYLAQSYKDIGDLDSAIEYYKKHINMRGWEEEIWYSYYMLTTLYLRKNLIKEAEEYALKGFIFRPKRIEALYALCQYFRINQKYDKAYYYYLLAKNIPFPKEDKLFLEYKVYDYELDYEHSIINFYVPWADKKEGLRSALKVINKNLNDEIEKTTIKNLSWYLEPLKNSIDFKSFPIDPKEIEVDGIKYYAASPSIFKNNIIDITNIRYVSYTIQDCPTVFNPDKNNLFRSLNYKYDRNTKKIVKMQEIILNPEEHTQTDSHIQGIEDLRLFWEDNKLKFIGQTGNFKNKKTDMIFNIVLGIYDFKKNQLLIEKIIESPYQNKVEKNWVHLNKKDFIYNWFPLQIGNVEDKNFVVKKFIDTPPLFKNMRGSCCAFEYKNMFWLLTHYNIDSYPNNLWHRQYKHCFIILDREYNLVAYSDPFTFENNLIEYSLGATVINNKFIICYSQKDRNSKIAELNTSYFNDKLNFINKKVFEENLTNN